MMDKSIEVVLIERNKQFVSCPFSNLVIGGTRQMVMYDDLEPSEKVKVYDSGVTLGDGPAGPDGPYEIGVAGRPLGITEDLDVPVVEVELPPVEIEPGRTAVLLDVDGTLGTRLGAR